jgi:hypothetical protein
LIFGHVLLTLNMTDVLRLRHFSQAYVTQQIMPKFLAMVAKNLVSPKAGLLNKSSCLAPALGVTNFIIFIDMIWVTLLLKWT